MGPGGMIGATLTTTEAAERLWDVAVVGAGPAGAMAARSAAQRGASVLLIEKSALPRDKVCGGCVGGGAMAVLRAAGLGGLPARLGAHPLRRMRLRAAGREANLPLRDRWAVSRRLFDAPLTAEAVNAGAHLLTGTKATLGSTDAVARWLRLRADGSTVSCGAQLVIAADGLGGQLMRTAAPAAVARGAYMGASAIVDDPPSWCAPGGIEMACGTGGYVGLTVLEDGAADVAAAFDPSFVRRCGSPGRAAGVVLDEAGFEPAPGLERTEWRGTPLLTRRPQRAAAERLLAAGDAAGYVEPFTGEGIGWALAAGRAAGLLAGRAVRQPRWRRVTEAQWQRALRRMLRGRQRRCAAVASLLRRPGWTRRAVTLLRRMPGLAGPLLRGLEAPIEPDRHAVDAPGGGF